MMSAFDYDLLVRAGRLFCAATGWDQGGAVAIRGDRIVAAGPYIHGGGRESHDFPHDLLLPGLVDLHTHPGPADWKYGIDADRAMLARGSTTVLSQGDAGAVTWPQYQADVIAPARTRIRLAINLARLGESRPGPCFQQADDVDVDACVAAIEAGGAHIWGISVNLSTAGCVGLDPRDVLRDAITVAERTNRPLLYGLRRETTDWPHWSLADQLALLRPGDVVTYCFHAGIDDQGTGSIVREGHVLPEVRAARERGILFDVGHGMASLDFDTAEAALADGFPPDTISTDVYQRHLGTVPQHDLPRTISKLIAAGMAETAALEAATARPAAVLGLAGEIGTLAPGACADLTVLRFSDTARPLADVGGATRPGGCWEPVFTVRAGRTVYGSWPPS